ncbi:hypothetical protein TURU_150340 [Turdus rufiventris]|nr:hypothetical protein TURU_150340 [Turdus rufiventris]
MPRYDQHPPQPTDGDMSTPKPASPRHPKRLTTMAAGLEKACHRCISKIASNGVGLRDSSEQPVRRYRRHKNSTSPTRGAARTSSILSAELRYPAASTICWSNLSSDQNGAAQPRQTQAKNASCFIFGLLAFLALPLSMTFIGDSPAVRLNQDEAAAFQVRCD